MADLAAAADLALFFTASEENSNESRFVLHADDSGLIFAAVFEPAVFAVEVLVWELFEFVPAFAVCAERVNVSRLGAEDVCLLWVCVLDLDAEPER